MRRRSAIMAAEKLALRAASLAVLDAWEQSDNLCAVMQAFYSGVDEHAQEQSDNLCAVMQAFYSGVDEHAQEQRRELIYQWR
ncbi:hypothetical protein PF003_g39352 [Phytophthora fragariae]|nr:hypothetical protein PF003_g39352 [Phytophthora fragariae]